MAIPKLASIESVWFRCSSMRGLVQCEDVEGSSERHSTAQFFFEGALYLPLVSRAWKKGSNSSYNCTPFLHALLTKGKYGVQ